MSHTYSYSFWTDFLTGQPISGVHPRAMLAIYAEITPPQNVSDLLGGVAIQSDCITGVVRQASLSIAPAMLSLPLVVSGHEPGQVGVSGMIHPVPLSLSYLRSGIGTAWDVKPFLVELSGGVDEVVVGVTGDIIPYLIPLFPPASLGLGISGKMESRLVPLLPPVSLGLGVAGRMESVPSPVTEPYGRLGISGDMTSGPPPGTDSFVAVAIYAEMQSRLEATFGEGMVSIAAMMSSQSSVSEQEGIASIAPTVGGYLLPRQVGVGLIAIVPSLTPYILPQHPGEYNLGISGDIQSVEGSRSQNLEGQVSISATGAMPPQLTLNMNHAYSLGAE